MITISLSTFLARASSFTGLVDAGYGKMRYGVAIDGKMLARPNGRDRYFATPEAAERALVLEQHARTQRRSEP